MIFEAEFRGMKLPSDDDMHIKVKADSTTHYRVLCEQIYGRKKTTFRARLVGGIQLAIGDLESVQTIVEGMFKTKSKDWAQVD